MIHLFSYLQFAINNLRFLGFGFVMVMASSFGQTYFIGIFGPAIRMEFDLTYTSWGGIYMVGTLASALLLPWTGQLIDRVTLPRYTACVILALAGACVFMAWVPSATLLIVAIFLLRQTGQGLMSLTGSTAMARYFPKDRGKAVGLSSIGFSIGESILPVLMVLAISIVGWRTTYSGVALATVVIVLPVAMWLLKGHHIRHQALQDQLDKEQLETDASSWSRREVLGDYRYYLLMPAVLAPSFVGTALFFHHLSLAELKGWDATWFTGSYWVYGTGTIISMLLSGPLIGRLTAVRVLPAFLMPMVAGLILVWAFDDAWWAWPYLFLFGLSSGLAFTGLTTLWAEIYGVKNLGAIKSLFYAISVFASALGPVTMGFMMDQGIPIENICLMFASYMVAASGLLWIALKAYREG